MKKYLILSFGLLVLALLLTGCDEPAKKVLYHSPADFLDDVYAPAPDCDYGSLVKPHDLTPGGETTITDPSPDLTWDFSGCDVYSFTIHVSEQPTFGLGDIIHDDVGETVHTYTNDENYLEDCQTYYWYITGWGSTMYESDIASFRTDFYGDCAPVEPCTGTPPEPILISPVWRSSTFANPQLVWSTSEPECAVENFHYQVSHTSDFSEIVLEGDTTLHSVSSSTAYLPNDCSTYFWLVTAEANGESTMSKVQQFETQFTGMCEHAICSGDQLTEPVLVWPAEGATITSETPEFLWSYDYDTCIPDHFVALVSTEPDFSYSLYHSGSGYQQFWQILWPGNFYNCTRYYWKVTAMTTHGETMVPSETGTFYTNFGNTICGLEYTGHIPIEMVKEFHLGCVSASQMWAIYEFKGPIVGDFEARIGGKKWPCELLEGTSNQLMCYGPLAPQQMDSEVELFLVGGEEPVLALEGFTPQCVGTIVCQPPAEGCSPKNIGTVKPIYVPTHWDASQCACVP